MDNDTYSQYYQDSFVLGLLGPVTNGTCIEMGAGNGKDISNSLFFEENLHWQSILIEPNPFLWDELAINRPNSIILHDCIFSERKEIDFTSFEDTKLLSGISSSFHKEHLTRGDVGKKYIQSKVLTRTFEDVFDEYNITKIEYLSLDTEGSELECLQGINFDKVDILLFGIEIEHKEKFELIERFLKTYGYEFIQQIGGDCFFYKNQ